MQSPAKRERLADGEALDAAGLTLVEGCRIVLDERAGESLRDAVFAAVEREALAEAVEAMARLARSPDDQ